MTRRDIKGQRTIFPTRRIRTNEEILAAYERTRSVWKAGKELGIAGQTVYDRLRVLGVQMSNREWTEDDESELRRLVEENCRIGEIAARLGRTYASVALRISRLGMGGSLRYRQKKERRVSGWTKTVTLQRTRQLSAYDGSLRSFCRENGFDIETFVQAMQRHASDFWDSYTESRSDLNQAQCPQCSRSYFPMSKKQTTCSRKCSNLLRVDRTYFGGNRSKTIGLAEGICQLCGNRPERALSSHHVLGKENDPDNLFLVALCAGCHKIVTLLATRKFTRDTTAWESLIGLVLARQNVLNAWVCVDIEHLSEEDIDDMVETSEIAQEEMA